ncbi:serine/threonine-protein phosphatase 7 long form homolog [Arachis stenosperma]|uniref:serine/threonine-protein phosphatase 7 long form homolog n=1 Tax=Arachis stenosperma TaxID=217475 RepID=UPI0025ABB572|nr:serine/threonine-protein phosphatase 7 long form homolog [Arachis stenosperma]
MTLLFQASYHSVRASLKVKDQFSLGLLPYIREAEFGHAIELRDFMFDNFLISVFVKRWRLKTYPFHLPWGDVSITLQDITYHIGLRTNKKPSGGCTRDFQQYHRHPTSEWIEDLLDARPPPQPEEEKQVFGMRMTWLRDRVSHIPTGTAPDTLRKHARCCLMMLIGGFLFTDKSAILVPLRWLLLLEDFHHAASCHGVYTTGTYVSLTILHRTYAPAYKLLVDVNV